MRAFFIFSARQEKILARKEPIDIYDNPMLWRSWSPEAKILK
jgi:hypothetical protein